MAILQNSLHDHIKLEENLQMKNVELEEELNRLKRSKSPPIAYKIEEIIEYIPIIKEIPKVDTNERNEKVKKAKKTEDDEILRLKTEINYLNEELEKERNAGKNEVLLKEFYERLCKLNVDLKESKEKANDLERNLADYHKNQKVRKMKRVKYLSEMIENLRNVGLVVVRNKTEFLNI